MTKVIKLALAASVLAGGLSANDVVTGSGSSFAYSIYKSWTESYYKATGKKVDYISKGSSKGIKDAKARLVNYGGTDAPLPPKELKKSNLYQFPSVVGAITMGYNLPGVNNLKLSRAAIVAISEGKVGYWDEKIITEENPGLKLPHKKVTFVHRSDGSGTTFSYTYYLSVVSKEWRHAYGAKKSLNWPGRQHVGGNKNTGVASLIKQTPYSVGYIDYADAVNNHILMADVENKAGRYITPNLASFQAGAAKASLDPKKDFFAMIADPAGAKSYPIITTTFVLVPAEKPQTDKKVTAFFDWAFKHGQKNATDLGYVPLPSSLTDKIEAYWEAKGIK